MTPPGAVPALQVGNVGNVWYPHNNTIFELQVHFPFTGPGSFTIPFVFIWYHIHAPFAHASCTDFPRFIPSVRNGYMKRMDSTALIMVHVIFLHKSSSSFSSSRTTEVAEQRAYLEDIGQFFVVGPTSPVGASVPDTRCLMPNGTNS